MVQGEQLHFHHVCFRVGDFEKNNTNTVPWQGKMQPGLQYEGQGHDSGTRMCGSEQAAARHAPRQRTGHVPQGSARTRSRRLGTVLR